MNRGIALFGATGLVGGACLRLLIADPRFSRVIIATRRPLAVAQSAAAVESHVIDFEKLDENAHLLAVDQVICALGTTIRNAGSQSAFRHVDFDYPLAIARLALSQGARHFLLVSALGANAKSRIFYNRVKGELETEILKLPFESHTIVRPSLLRGERTEFRFAEQLAMRFDFLLPSTYKPVPAAAVARVLVDAASAALPGAHIIESAQIRRRMR